jgi:16S rRNA (cytosine967-C5)-methyltransferase
LRRAPGWAEAVPNPARVLALRLLGQVEAGGDTLAELMASRDAEALPARDRALLHELVLGTLRRRGFLDAALVRVVDRPLGRLDRPALWLLRLGAYQLLRMRVPAHAAVSESVDLARLFCPRAAGLINAALRRLARDGAPPAPSPVEEPLAWLTSEGSLPEWLALRWLQRLGPEAAVRRTRAFLEVPSLSFRLNPRVTDALAQAEQAGLTPQPLPVPGAFRSPVGPIAPLLAAGVLYAQDLGSQLAAELCAHPGEVLDACAAPGGKSLLMADRTGRRGRVVGLEVSPRRLRSFATLARRWGSTVLCLGGDALRPPFSVRFDAVLLDAPCSGLGTLGRHPDVRWRIRETEIARQAERQARLLDSVAGLVKPGGRLVYSVCSSEPEEGAEVVEAFVARRGDFQRLPTPDWCRPFACPDGFLRTGPEEDGGDAFFVAVLSRE